LDHVGQRAAEAVLKRGDSWPSSCYQASPKQSLTPERSTSFTRKPGRPTGHTVIRAFLNFHTQIKSISGIVFVIRNGLRWRDAPSAYGPRKTSYYRWKRWGEAGVFTRMMEGYAAADPEPKTVIVDAIYLKAHSTASSLRVKRGFGAVSLTRTAGGRAARPSL
jgi:transposase